MTSESKTSTTEGRGGIGRAIPQRAESIVMDWLIEVVRSTVAWDDAEPADRFDEIHYAQVLCNLTLMTLVIERGKVPPPDPIILRSWRCQYLKLFDALVAPHIPNPQERALRRLAIGNVFDRLEQAGAARRPATAATATLQAEPDGILTTLTHRLEPDKALELYRKIAPGLVCGILDQLDASANVSWVRRGVDHLCDPAVQARLSVKSQVRDAILDELTRILGQADIRRQVDRDQVLAILKSSGNLGDLVAMENCLHLAQRAG